MADAGWNPELRPEPIPVIDLPEADLRPVPRLVLTRRAFGAASSPSDPYPFRRALPDALDYGDLPVALLQFRYGPVTLDNPVGDRTERVTIPGARVIHRFRRDLAEEAQRRHTLETLGFVPVSRFPGVPTSEARTSANAFAPWPESLTQSESEDLWYEFLAVLPQLKAAGWEVETDSAFDLVLTEADEWWTDLEEGSTSQWFRFDAGIEIGGRRLSLVEALREYALGLNGEEDWNVLCEAPEDAMVPLRLPGEDLVLAFPARRLGQLLACLYELFQAPGADGEFLHRLAAARIAGLLPELEGETIRALRALGKRLHDFQGIRKVKAPRSLKAELRPYQTDGLSWLQFLRAHDLGGVLADDMGLGKTVQTLAHLLTEKAAKRLDRPCLILAPSSLVGNWAAEAARFAPSLRVLSLQGPERKTRFEEIPDHDVVLSSYALLPRDEEALQAHDYHLVILDEAQYIKNPTSKVALAACSLRARHRLCLTGTPMENHLGELWSLFHFLMPGFLGAADVFRRQWRRPIEQDRSSEKRALLASRIAPLMLRRTRAQVLDELPPRTEILRTVPLDREQAELYEVVRAAMDRKVREAISAKGLARSQIIVLDALLKLRQICCHPSLLKLPTAKKAKRSAKLDLFRELITGLAEEKRRVLVFSQFTSMLEILERSLREESIPWVKLTGDTPSVDRAELVRQFQEGDVPVFLISLKAGGTGLNLTAADTVIHYDPWWNPAVEEQATGRAHRMGQKNPVMVYRLVTEGTIEERILDLQRRKAEIAGAILGDAEGSQEAGLAIEREDLERLLAPI
jgi:superfamily II DNA or RNA helicase